MAGLVSSLHHKDAHAASEVTSAGRWLRPRSGGSGWDSVLFAASCPRTAKPGG